jgi:hypothetical protein
LNKSQVDNRSRELNPQDPVFYKCRGASEHAAQVNAQIITKENQMHIGPHLGGIHKDRPHRPIWTMDKATVDNRSRELNPQDPAFYKCRGASEDAARYDAALIRAENQAGEGPHLAVSKRNSKSRRFMRGWRNRRLLNNAMGNKANKEKQNENENESENAARDADASLETNVNETEENLLNEKGEEPQETFESKEVISEPLISNSELVEKATEFVPDFQDNPGSFEQEAEIHA